jgi:hypothetical protein
MVSVIAAIAAHIVFLRVRFTVRFLPELQPAEGQQAEITVENLGCA